MWPFRKPDALKSEQEILRDAFKKAFIETLAAHVVVEMTDRPGRKNNNSYTQIYINAPRPIKRIGGEKK